MPFDSFMHSGFQILLSQFSLASKVLLLLLGSVLPSFSEVQLPLQGPDFSGFPRHCSYNRLSLLALLNSRLLFAGC
jgi:hypothetical protein